MLNNTNRIHQLLGNLVRVGTVDKIFPQQHAVRVVFDERGITSAILPVLVPFAGSSKIYALPEIGSSVVVLSASNDSSGGGYVIGSLYSGKNPPEEASEDITKLSFSDKTFLSYDKQNHEFRIQFNDGTFICYDGQNNELEISCKGNILINGQNRLEVSTRSEIEIESAADIEMQGRNIRLN